MRSSWESIRAGLLQWLETREATRSFERLQTEAAELHTYTRPADLVEAVVHSTDLVGKDRVLKILIVARGSAALRRLSQALLILCVWPGLDFIFRRRIAVFRCSPEELAAEIVERFSEVVHRTDLHRVTCVTATLVRNTDRAIVDARCRETATEHRMRDSSDELSDRPSGVSVEAPFGIPCGRWDVHSLAGLRAWLEHAVGDDADLVMDAVLLGKSGHELAQSFGISHAAARKRLGRALARARHAFLGEGQSQTASSTRFC